MRIADLKRLPIAAMLTCLTACFLAGCFLPDRFKAVVYVGRNADYRISFTGEIVDVLAAAELAAQRRIPDDPESQTVLESLRRASGVARSERVARDRYEIVYTARGALAPGETVRFPPTARPLILLRRAGNEVFLESAAPSEQEIRLLRRLGLRMRGELKLTATGSPSQHNADAEPGVFDRAYSWSFENVGERRPRMTVRLGPGQ